MLIFEGLKLGSIFNTHKTGGIESLLMHSLFKKQAAVGSGSWQVDPLK
jgi:hypothetical protein